MPLIVLSIGALGVRAEEPASAPREVRLRIAWGGAAATNWRGSLQVTQGSIREPVPLGAAPELPGMLSVGPSEVRWNSLRPQLYEAFDVTVVGTDETKLRLELQEGDSTTSSEVQELELAELAATEINVPLGDKGNRLLIQPAPGDALRVDLGREHLVFQPSETWEISVRPNPATRAQESRRIQLEMGPSGGTQVLFRTQETLRPNASGALPSWEGISLEVPATEGVYELRLRMNPIRVTPAFGSDPDEVSRNVQFVVVDTVPKAPKEREAWRNIMTLDPCQPRWWERLPRTGSWTRGGGALAEVSKQEQAKLLRESDQTWMTLAPQSVQVYPLIVARIDQPHLLELEFSDEHEQSLSLSILDGDAAGDPIARPAQAAFQVTPPPERLPREDPPRPYRMLFWARSAHPLLLLRNESDIHMSFFRKLRVWAGPTNLPPLFAQETQVGWRQGLAYFEEPLLPEMFSAVDAVDKDSNRHWTDWRTFHTAANRLAEYLRYTGQAGASMAVLSDGGTLFPDPRLQGSTRFDSGAYFLDGRDPVPKDVLEMLFRVFDREGLKFVPGLKFSGTLPELERLRRQPGEEGVGIELVHRDGRSWRESRGVRRGSGAFYNPLDPRVQAELIEITKRLVDRYGHHPSFGGVRLDLTPECSAIPPDPDWGHDSRTRESYQAWLARSPRGSGSSEQESGSTAMTAEARERDPWLAWRCERLSELYAGMASAIRKIRPEGKLYLGTPRLAQSLPLREALAAKLPAPRDGLRGFHELGLDLKRCATLPGVVVTHPSWVATGDTLQDHATALELAADEELAGGFPEGRPASSVVQHRVVGSREGTRGPLSSTAWERVDRVGSQIPVDHLTGALPEAALRELHPWDAETLFIGGPRPSLGNLDQQRDFHRLLRQLPIERSVAVQSTRGKEAGLRRIVRGDHTYLLVANPTPWPVRWTIPVEGLADNFLPHSATGPGAGNLERLQQGWTWSPRLQGHDLTFVRLPTASLEVLQPDRQWPDGLEDALRDRVSGMVRRVATLHEPSPLAVPDNADFERGGEGDPIESWESSQMEGTVVRRDTSQWHDGAASAQISSEGAITWIRSNTFPAPRTGRISLQVWIRGESSMNAPIRLALEGILDGQPYYRFAQIDPPRETVEADTWRPYVLVVPDLPVTGMRDLRVRVDLLGRGTIWLDGLRMYDASFQREELQELSEIVAVADLQLREHDLEACHQTLGSYWPRMVLAEVADTPVQVAEAPASPGTPPLAKAPPAKARDESTSPRMLDRMRRLLPMPGRVRR